MGRPIHSMGRETRVRRVVSRVARESMELRERSKVRREGKRSGSSLVVEDEDQGKRSSAMSFPARLRVVRRSRRPKTSRGRLASLRPLLERSRKRRRGGSSKPSAVKVSVSKELSERRRVVRAGKGALDRYEMASDTPACFVGEEKDPQSAPLERSGLASLCGLALGLMLGGRTVSVRCVRQSGCQRVRMGLEERLRSRREERARI